MNKRRYRYKLGRGESRQIIILDAGKYEIELTGEGAEVEVLGALVAGGGEKTEVEVHSIHKRPNCRSNVFIKMVAQDESRVRLTGMIKIKRRAQKTKAFLKEDVLMTADKCQAEVVPDLEIEANDVSASHAATVGKIDEEQIYYLMSRGMERENSRLLIMEGFLREVVKRVKDKELQRKMIGEIKSKIYGLEQKRKD